MMCSICYEPIRWYQKKTLTCKHSFHRSCINKWFKKKLVCPYCKQSVYKPKPYKRKTKPLIIR